MIEILEMDLAELFGQAELLTRSGNKTAAKNMYRIWLAETSSPVAYAARFNLASLLSDSNELPEAEALLRQALLENPDFYQARFNLGTVMEKQGRIDDALAVWSELLGLPENENTDLQREMLIMALNHSGRVLETSRRYAEAEAMLRRSLAIDPTQSSVIHHFVHLRQKQCAWPIYEELPNLSRDDLLKSTSALAMLDISDDPAIQLAAAQRYVNEKIKLDVQPLANPSGYQHDKIRVGYLSSDFCLHAVLMLTIEIFELHDRSQFEVYGFSWSRQDGSYLRQRVQAALDHYIPITEMTDEQAAQCIRDNEIDILVDLQGLTSGARANILALRPAPLQVTYLGFPGTTGLPCIDYVLCDRYVVPEEAVQYFTEKPMYLPNVFQISDRKRPVGETPTRASCGLPDDKIVFCAFNNNHKYTPELFEVWVNVLRQVDDSVLWLLQDNRWVKENLQQFCKDRGVAPERLIFAERVAPADYLARYKIADLFLDCFPFNGGTTANDALFMGLPIVTLSGRTFASRMAGSLLNSFGLNELVTHSFAEYEEKVVGLANNPARILELRRYIEAHRDSSQLFDMPQLVRDIEKQFIETLQKTLCAPTSVGQRIRTDPVIGLFFGITVIIPKQPVPQIHANYHNQQLAVEIVSGNVISGSFARKQERLLLAWLEIHREDLLANWQLLNSGKQTIVLDALR